MIDYGIMGFVGPEGSGKSCLMTYFALKHALKGGRLLAFPGYAVTDGKGHELSKAIATEEWIALGPELKDVIICIDEIQNFFNSTKFQATINQLFANFSAQRRHRNIGILYTLQDWGWLDPRVRWVTHVLGVCRDNYWSPWGKEEGIGRGERLSVIFYDVKGFYTGQPWTASLPFNLYAKPIWGCYDSYCDVDIWSGMSKVKIKKPVYDIDLTGGPAQKSENPPGPEAYEQTQQGDAELLDELGATGAITPAVLGALQRRLRRG